MTDLYTVFIVQGYELQSADGQLFDLCVFEIITNTAEEALNQAKKLVKKKEYRISQVIQRHRHDKS